MVFSSQPLLRISAALAAGAALGAAAVGAFGAWRLNGPRRIEQFGFSPFEVGVESEDVTFTADDGVELAGWWLDDSDGEIAVICCHGHRGTKADMLGIGPGLHRAGHSVLLFDFRGSGDSGDGPLSVAHHEQRDLAAAVGWVRERRPDARIAVVGFSMGASTAILAAAKDDRIEALVLDSPFTALSDVVATELALLRLPSRALMPAVGLVNRLRYGYEFAQVRPVDAISSIAPRPILLLHGADDPRIPLHHAERLRDAAAPGTVEFMAFEGAEHCGGYFADRPGYIARVDEFLRRVL